MDFDIKVENFLTHMEVRRANRYDMVFRGNLSGLGFDSSLYFA